MFDEIIKKANELLSASQPFAIAVVVRYEAPISGKPGDKAIIQADGKIFGWIGGGCTQPVVIKEAQNAIKDGKPRFVRVTPTSSSNTVEGILEYNMSCHSGGTLDVYIEPVLPKPQLVIMGKSAVARALAKLGKILNYHIKVVALEADKHIFPDADSLHPRINPNHIHVTPQTYVIVSTQGEADEEALAEALKINVPYIAFVASQKKAAAVFQYLKKNGASDEQLDEIRVPAGLDIKAHLPEEIAISILAEIILMQRSSTKPVTESQEAQMTVTEPKGAKDPICGMSVETSSAKHTSEYQGKTYYFCCAGCKQKFEKEPEKHIAAAES